MMPVPLKAVKLYPSFVLVSNETNPIVSVLLKLWGICLHPSLVPPCGSSDC